MILSACPHRAEEIVIIVSPVHVDVAPARIYEVFCKGLDIVSFINKGGDGRRKFAVARATRGPWPVTSGPRVLGLWAPGPWAQGPLARGLIFNHVH